VRVHETRTAEGVIPGPRAERIAAVHGRTWWMYVRTCVRSDEGNRGRERVRSPAHARAGLQIFLADLRASLVREGIRQSAEATAAFQIRRSIEGLFFPVYMSVWAFGFHLIHGREVLWSERAVEDLKVDLDAAIVGGAG